MGVTIANARMTAERVPLAVDAKVILDGKDGQLSDLKAGMRVTLQMSAQPDRGLIIGITKGRAAKVD